MYGMHVFIFPTCVNNVESLLIARWLEKIFHTMKRTKFRNLFINSYKLPEFINKINNFIGRTPN